jgi:hypothetical protein
MSRSRSLTSFAEYWETAFFHECRYSAEICQFLLSTDAGPGRREWVVEEVGLEPRKRTTNANKSYTVLFPTNLHLRSSDVIPSPRATFRKSNIPPMTWVSGPQSF